MAESPDTSRDDLLAGVAMSWSGASRSTAEVLLQSARDTFAEWPVHRELSFRDLAVYLAVEQYLRVRCSKGTQINMQRVIGKLIPNNL